MARKLEEIQNELLTAKANESMLSNLDSTSKVSIFRLWIYIVAFSTWTLEKLFDTHKADVDYQLSILKPHTARWYRNMALAFQYGFDLLTDSDKFDNNGKTQQEIENAKIIKYSAVTEAETESRLIIKIATEANGLLAPVSTTQLDAFKAYIAEIKDAGVRVSIINYLPDLLKLNLRIVRDALILDVNGMNRQTAEFPVNDAIQAFIKELPFNGELSLQKLEERLLAVEGVLDLSLDLAQTSWIDGNAGTYGTYQAIDISTIPISGYFKVNLTDANDTKSTLTYV